MNTEPGNTAKELTRARPPIRRAGIVASFLIPVSFQGVEKSGGAKHAPARDSATQLDENPGYRLKQAKRNPIYEYLETSQ